MSTELILKGEMSSDARVPAHAREDAGLGTELVKQYVKPSRLKVLQPMKGEKYEAFDAGDLVITPQGVLLTKAGEPFWFVPLFFYPEWCIVNPLELKSTLPMIRARTLDVKSEIARRANDPELRNKEICPDDPKGKLTLRYVEYLNFIVVIVKRPDLASTPMVMSFSKAEHKSGSNLASLISMRGQAALCSNVFEGVVPTKKRSNELGSWYGLDVMNPTSEDAPPPFVMDRGEYEQLKQMHLMLKQAHLDKLLIIDQEEAEADIEPQRESQF